MVVVIDNYDSFTYNLVQYIGEVGYSAEVFRNDEISIEEVLALNPSHVVVSPGPCTPDEAGISVDLIKTAGHICPILGVCLGHQSLGRAFGANIVRGDFPIHGKTSIISNEGIGIFKGLPQKFIATRYHSLIIERDSLPNCLQVTAVAEDEVIMGLQHESLRLYGVQFHPESILSEYGYELLKNFLKGI